MCVSSSVTKVKSAREQNGKFFEKSVRLPQQILDDIQELRVVYTNPSDQTQTSVSCQQNVELAVKNLRDRGMRVRVELDKGVYRLHCTEKEHSGEDRTRRSVPPYLR